jgi:signal transduction histidine kinase
MRPPEPEHDLRSITHDLNNLLTAISGYASLLVTNEDATPEIQRDAGDIAEAAARATALVRALRS